MTTTLKHKNRLIGSAMVFSIAISIGATAQETTPVFTTELAQRDAQPAPPGERSVLGMRILQSDIANQRLRLLQIIQQGERIFTSQFNQYDGHGDGPFQTGDDNVSSGQRPSLQNNGQFLRVNGLDSQSCNECHTIISNATTPPILGVGGAGGVAQNAMAAMQQIDAADLDGDGVANINDASRQTSGRFINPPFILGSGGVEQIGKEMTADLQALKAQAIANPGQVVALITKGISFGEIVADARGNIDTSGIQGIDEDLAVKPFGRKGSFSTTREFDTDAASFHFGIQAIELVGVGVDGDNDGVVNELTIGEVSALAIHSALLPAPAQRMPRGTLRRSVRRGERLFESEGCSSCHTPTLHTESRQINFSFPVVPTEPHSNIYYSAPLKLARFKPSQLTDGVEVPMFSDLKRHDMGSGLAESTASPLASQFITPRLWGVADTAPYLHDGRAITLTAAIDMHGGEGQFAADNFNRLFADEKESLLDFLRSLRTPGSNYIGPRHPNPFERRDSIDNQNDYQNDNDRYEQDVHPNEQYLPEAGVRTREQALHFSWRSHFQNGSSENR